ncbi:MULTISPECIES: valine--tRNA ligase [Methanobacterium]|jgi:valyl-tRNA synthetase|uniref:Valine--tRNA ligase n=1 Tax=Methanobacterium subterraneum TaxID=59277 RepID=A0A7K4DJS1_9EURY|nr:MULTISPECIES: valine--tRNA ligase [Methanobacterium]AUB58978.1 valine--tRNA ligase [Methanobacterium sp. MZ-A1]MBW4257683.1 valine--tRNA ligase [Methanobacterium sp. YSL]NMO08697.1 valine--tRNA ligase [Methanobacterium subterraneum]
MKEVEVPKDYNHENEINWQATWQRMKLYQFNPDEKRPRYIIDTPPPYPTGSIHIGHVLNWLYMDLLARWKRMQGHSVLFPQGWDCHGLPTEVKVEEIHGIKKNDVPREEFRQMCIELTKENIQGMKTQMQRMGYSQDWNREYVTMTPEYKEKTQRSFLQMYHEGLIYRAVHPVNWCPRCETAIAFAEVEYQENETFLNYLEFPDPAGETGVPIATTRPELLAACVAVVVHPEDERYQHLTGKKVQVPLFNREVEIITDEEVDPDFGTGAVMICTFGDKTDVTWVNRYDLDIIEAINEQGIMQDVCGKYSGLTLTECKDAIVEDLDKEGFLTRKEKVDQNVGQCWRCKTPIEILVKKQWFVAVKQMNPQIIDAAEGMDWIPEHMKTRLLNWTGSMDWDWCISRQRIFATPIPVWYCKECGEVMVPSEEEVPLDPTQTQPTKPCQCGSTEFIAEEDVLDTWMDSSITPLVIAGWPGEEYQDLFPATIRQQGHDIIRTWAFYTILRTLALTGDAPFQNVVVNGMVFGEDGHKMSKSRGNVIAPEDVVEEYGADALRLWAANSVPGSDVPFAWKDVQHGYKFLRKFWNAFRFVNMHLAAYSANNDVESIKTTLKPLDKWILSGLNQLVGEVTHAMDDYNFAHARNRIQAYIWHDFCDDYIEAVKYRLYTDEEGESKQAALYTLNTVIQTCLRLMAPFTPHFTEEIHYYLEGYGNAKSSAENDNVGELDKTIDEDVFRSIHQETWPEVVQDLVDPVADGIGQLGAEVIGELRRFKASRKMPLNTPLKAATIYSNSPEKYNHLLTLEDDIKGTMRIEELMVSEGKPDVREIVVEITPRMDKIGPEFKGQAPVIVKYLQSHDPQEIADSLEEDGSIDIEGSLITADYISTSKELVGRTGEKVELLLLEEMDLVMELVI